MIDADAQEKVVQILGPVADPVRVVVRLSALTRVEYSAEVEVPREVAEDRGKREDFVREMYERVDGCEFEQDVEYWESGVCSLEEVK